MFRLCLESLSYFSLKWVNFRPKECKKSRNFTFLSLLTYLNTGRGCDILDRLLVTLLLFFARHFGHSLKWTDVNCHKVFVIYLMFWLFKSIFRWRKTAPGMNQVCWRLFHWNYDLIFAPVSPSLRFRKLWKSWYAFFHWEIFPKMKYSSLWQGPR